MAVPGASIILLTMQISQLLFIISHKKQWNSTGRRTVSNHLKDALTQAPVLCYPCFKKGFTLQTDASAVGIGAVLEQEGHVIAYASRSLTPPERQYSVIERECLAVVFAVKHFRHYLPGRPFSLHTDHGFLLRRWRASCADGLLTLQEFDFEIKYRQGSSNAMQCRCSVPCT